MRFRGILPAFIAGLVFANISEADASGFARVLRRALDSDGA
jgi:hypothetical protein